MEKRIMIKYIVNEEDRTVTAKFISNKDKDTDRDIWLEYIVDGIYKAVAETKECSNVFLTDKVVYPRVKKFLERAKLSNEFYCSIAKCNKIDTFDVTKGKYLAKKRLLKKYYKILNDVLLSLVYDINIPTSIPFKVCEDSVKKVNDILDEIHFFKKYGIMLDDYIAKVQEKEALSKNNMNNNNYAQKQEKEKKQLVFDSIKIEVKDSVVKVTVYDEYGEYVSEVTCDDSDLDSVIRATKKAIIHVVENMKGSWPKYNSLYYTPHFTNSDLVRARNWIDCTFDRNLKKNNLVFRTKEEAVAVAKKMLETISAQKRGQRNGQ